MTAQDVVIGIRQSLSGLGSQSTLIALAAVLIVLLALGIVVAAVLRSRTPRGRIDALLEGRARGRRASRWLGRIMVLAMLALAFVGSAWYLNRPETCRNCHRQTDYGATLAESPHKGIRCLSCHAQTGITRPALVVADYTRWTYVYASQKTDPDPAAGSMSPSQCLRCHEGVAYGTSENAGIRVRHSDFLHVNGDCSLCHNSVAHGDAVKAPASPTMNGCVVCHDGVTASAECDTCHLEESYDTSGTPTPKLQQVDSSNCYDCHAEKPCIQCHGVTMPHPEGWGPEDGGPGQSGSHAEVGFTNRDLCWRCHFAEGQPFEPSDESCSCHGLFGQMHGGEAWVAEHGLEASGAKPGLDNECFTCHGQYLCDQCHPSSYAKRRYNPSDEYVPGPTYERDIPYDPDYWEY